MNEELITAKLKEIESLTEKDAGKPNIPVTIVLQEAEDLFSWCKKDKEVLIRAGLNWKLVEDLPLRTDALRVSQSRWKSEYKDYQDCQEEWKKVSPEAFNLRDVLVHYFYHAFYNNQAEYAKVKRIDEGSSNADMIQDLIDLSALGMKNTTDLQAVGLDLALLDTARARSFELAGLLAKVNGAHNETSPLLINRNKAFAHLKEAMNEIRRIGQFVFWRNHDSLIGYVSQYSRKLNQSRKKKTEPSAPGNQ